MKTRFLYPTGKKQSKKTMRLQFWTTFHGKEKITHRVKPSASKEETRATEQHSWAKEELSPNQETSNIYPDKIGIAMSQ